MQNQIIYRLLRRFVAPEPVIFEPVTHWVYSRNLGRDKVEWGYSAEDAAEAALTEYRADERYLADKDAARPGMAYMLLEDRALETGRDRPKYRIAQRVGEYRYEMTDHGFDDEREAVEFYGVMNRHYWDAVAGGARSPHKKPGSCIIVKEIGRPILHPCDLTRIDR